MPISSSRCTDAAAAVLALGVALLGAVPARAQDAEAAALFQTGKELAAKQAWREACPKFEASYKREPALGNLMNLADCNEHLQRLAHAWGEWQTAEEMATKAGDADRADLAKRRAAALEPRLPKLRVDVTGTQADLGVYRDDELLDPGAYGTELPADPGTRTITVRRGGAVLATRDVDMKERAHERAAFDLDAIAKEHPAPPPSAEEGATRALRITGNVTLGVGIGVVVLGGVLEGAALGVKGGAQCIDNPDANGAPKVCTADAVQSIGTARTLANTGLGLLIGGSLLTATGIALKVVAAKRGEVQPPNVGIVPTPGGALVTWEATF